jgi:hypothetical protein
MVSPEGKVVDGGPVRLLNTAGKGTAVPRTDPTEQGVDR